MEVTLGSKEIYIPLQNNRDNPVQADEDEINE